MDVEDVMESEIQKSAKAEYALSPEECQVFQRIEAMEGVHNELMANLGVYRDNFHAFRNEFLKRLHAKYNIPKETHKYLMYDPLKKRLVSVFNNDTNARKIIVRPYAFRKIASDIIVAGIKQLTDVFNVTQKEIGK